ncbi:hypothetical protein AGMMS49983_12290 [Clostridia bacterium]|nr:hypothetical protein AGMMS49983_12290 [Clostridia bacterium]
MEESTDTKNAVTYYSEAELKDPVCCICGEKSPEREFRGLGVCSHCIEYIKIKGLTD